MMLVKHFEDEECYMLAKDLNYLSLMMKFLYLHNEPVTEEVQRWSLLVDRFL